MLVRYREINLQSQVKELGRARTTAAIDVEMQCGGFDSHIQKKRKQKISLL